MTGADQWAGRRPLTTRERQAAVLEAHRWLKTPWRHQGAVLGAGVDCGNLLLEVLHAAGCIIKQHTGAYSQDWMHHRRYSKFTEEVEKYARQIDWPPAVGDLVLFGYGLCVSHGGIMVSDNEFIHAYAPARCVVKDNISHYSNIAGYWEVMKWAE